MPGSRTDQRWVRLASRRMYGQMLEAGMRIFEYERGMTHVKALIVDDLWAVIGTTNLDNRSFEHNDEVNVAFRDGGVSARLLEDFERDPAAQPRNHARRLAAPAGLGKAHRLDRVILERQQ